METITLPRVINWPEISTLSRWQGQTHEIQVYTDFLERVKNTPKPKTLEQELVLISSVDAIGIAPVAFNILLVLGEVRDAYYNSHFWFKCLNVIVEICCPTLARLIDMLVLVPLVYRTSQNMLLSLPKNKHLTEKVAQLAISASQSTEALGNLDIALGQILRYKCPLSLASLSEIQAHDRVTFQYMAIVNETRRVQLFSFACRKEHLDSYKEEIKTECKRIKQCFRSFKVEANIKVQCSLECTGLEKIKKRAEAQLSFASKEKVLAEGVYLQAQQLTSVSTKEEYKKVKREVLSLENSKRRKS